MATRYQGDSIVVSKSEDAAAMLARTASLPEREIEGALLRFGVEYGGNRFWIHYMVVGKRPLVVRRVTGLDGDNDMFDVPANLIDRMSGSDIRFMVDQLRTEYRNNPLIVRYMGDKAREKQGARIRGKFDGVISATK